MDFRMEIVDFFLKWREFHVVCVDITTDRYRMRDNKN